MKQAQDDTIRQTVRKEYGNLISSVASQQGQAKTPCCCGGGNLTISPNDIGYSSEDVTAVPEVSQMSFGCGNPGAAASLKPGETVVDLGCGGGFDSFLAAKAVGETGNVIGVDMTPEMLSQARGNCVKMGTQNVEFRLGEIEHLPVEDNIADVILSNCVISLSPDKQQVFHDAFRVLKPGGRLAISDIVAIRPLPEETKNDMSLYTGCLGGAAFIGDLGDMLQVAGFTDITIISRKESQDFIRKLAPEWKLADSVVSATIEAIKPQT